MLAIKGFKKEGSPEDGVDEAWVELAKNRYYRYACPWVSTSPLSALNWWVWSWLGGVFELAVEAGN
jgi:hypothetical protein